MLLTIKIENCQLNCKTYLDLRDIKVYLSSVIYGIYLNYFSFIHIVTLYIKFYS